MTDRHRLTAAALFLPAIAAESEPVFRDAYLRRLAVLTGTSAAVLRLALLRFPPGDNPEALRVLGLLLPVRP